MNEDRDYVVFSDHMLRGAEKLDSLYQTMKENDPVDSKLRRKQEMIRKIVDSLDTLSLSASSARPSARFGEQLPNNAYFLNFIRYQAKQDIFLEEWNGRFHGDLKAYIEYLSEKYPFL
jgi:hypothetical protein